MRHIGILAVLYHPVSYTGNRGTSVSRTAVPCPVMPVKYGMHPFDGADDGEVAARTEYDGLARVEERVDRALHYLGVSPDTVDVRPALSDQVLYWLSRGSLIQAIMAHREETGVGLKEAKDAVEGRGVALPSLERLERKLDALLARLGEEAGRAAAETTDDFRDPLAGETVDSLLRQDRLIEAIKVYRQQSGVGLAEAKSAVEARLRQMGTRAPT